MKTKLTLEQIAARYSSIEFNNNNFEVGGGLSNEKFASRRHEDARNDAGKLTFGEACQMFKRATGADLEHIKEIIKYAVPFMEWHHAGSFNGKMKKTYFLNAAEIVDIAKNWYDYEQKLELHNAQINEIESKKREKEQEILNFLQKNAKYYERVPESELPKFFYTLKREMNGKYGWFDSTYKNYKMPEYYTGWWFDSEEKYKEFLILKNNN